MRRFSVTMLMALVLLAIGMYSGVIAPAPEAFAQARYGIRTSEPIESTGILVDRDGNTMDYPVWIYGVTIFADASSSFVGLYDVDTDAELTSATIAAKDEIGEATQYDSETKWYPKPAYYSDGVGAIITTGVAQVHYGPQP